MKRNTFLSFGLIALLLITYACIGVTPVTSAPTVQPKAAPTTQPTILQPSADVVSILSSAKPGQVYQLVDGEVYRLSGQVNPKLGGWTLLAGKAVMAWNPNAGSCIRAGADGIHVQGGDWMTNSTPVDFLAPNCRFDYAVIADGAERAALIDSFHGTGGVNATVAYCKIGRTLSVSVYTSEDGSTIAYNSFAGSIGETTVRVSQDTSGHTAANVKIVGNDIAGGGYQKGVGEFRNAKNATFSGNVCHDYLRAGQSGQTHPGQAIDGLLIQWNQWPEIPTPQQVDTHLLLMSGSIVTVDHNSFNVDAVMECADLWGPSIFSLTNNTRHVAKGVTPRPLMYNASNVGGATIAADSGNTVVSP